MKYQLKYGEGTIAFDAPPRWSVQLIDHARPEPCSFEKKLGEVLDNPIGSEPFKDWLRYQDLLIIVSDVTRYSGAERFLPPLCERFLKGKKAQVLFALGNHRKQTDEEKRDLVSPGVYDAFPCIDHDCFDDSVNTFLGRTPSGLDISINKALLDKEAAIVTGAIGFHYLAGFSGGRKALFPGISSYDTILGVHKTVFYSDKPGKHHRVQSGMLSGNPMHEAMLEALALVRKPLFLINTVVDDEGTLLNVFAGDVRQAHEAGCTWYGDQFMVTVKEKADVAIVSAGGYPKDINFIQAHKALEHAKGGVKGGGTIILSVQCRDGCGTNDFLRWFDYPSLEEMEPYVRKSDKVYAQTAYSTRMKAEKYRIILVSDLGEDIVRTMGLVPARSLSEALTQVDTGKDLLCYVMPEGAKTLVRAEET